MKKILITGATSYVGKSFEASMKQFSDSYLIDTVSSRDNIWKEIDFSTYDVIFHVAGIAHVSADPKMADQYYKVNRDLTLEIAKKAMEQGVKQFIFMSSIIVYGDSGKIADKRVIDQKTIPAPTNYYGMSKLQAEEGLMALSRDNFKVVILRTPMVYGKGSRGNYNKLSNYAKKMKIFPDIENERSSIHIENLCEFIRLMIKNEEYGYFYPQNEEYLNTSKLVKLIGEVNGKNIILIKVFNPLLKLMGNKVEVINKVFGNLAYTMEMSEYKEDYRVRSLIESIRVTEVE